MPNDQASSTLPTALTVHTQSRVLEITYDNGEEFVIPFELMRVYSPSAEVMGHGPGQETLQVGKRDVLIESVEPVGHYAIKPVFSDGHDSGLFSWDYLYWLGGHKESLWQDYLARLEQAGASRDPSALPANKSSSGGCGSGGCGSGGCS